MRLQASPAAPWQDERVELFLLEEADVGPAYVGWLNDPLVNRFLESRFAVHDEASTRAFVGACLADPDVLMLGVRSRILDGRHVGNIKLGPIDRRHGLGEIGVLIGDREAWGGGIASSAIRLLCGIAVQQLGLRKLTAGCYVSNMGSERAFLKAGFIIEGRRPRHFLLEHGPEDLVLMACWPQPAATLAIRPDAVAS
jgi:ribosomal-protein-alanine N-acetyltransferase